MLMIHYQSLDPSDIDDLSDIDRRDQSSSWCVIRDGGLVEEERDFKHPGFSSAQWEDIIQSWKYKLTHHEKLLIGAYDENVPIGVAGLDIDQKCGCNKDLFNFGPLWISPGYRGRGIGRRLFDLIREEAEKLDIQGMYVSATPVPRTVGFYKAMGCRLLTCPDPQLIAEEPEDIHMQIRFAQQDA